MSPAYTLSKGAPNNGCGPRRDASRRERTHSVGLRSTSRREPPGENTFCRAAVHVATRAARTTLRSCASHCHTHTHTQTQTHTSICTPYTLHTDRNRRETRCHSQTLCVSPSHALSTERRAGGLGRRRPSAEVTSRRWSSTCPRGACYTTRTLCRYRRMSDSCRRCIFTLCTWSGSNRAVFRACLFLCCIDRPWNGDFCTPGRYYVDA